MRFIFAFLLILAYYTVEADVISDCFQTGTVLYGNENGGTDFNDLDYVTSLSKDHVLTSIYGCESSSGR